MRRYLKVPQIAAVMGPCIAGGAYLPALSDLILMVEGTSFMGLGGPNLVKGATGQTTDTEESLGGAYTHNAISGVAHYRVPDDRACLSASANCSQSFPLGAASSLREPRALPRGRETDSTTSSRATTASPTKYAHLLACILDAGELVEFQADHAPEMICGTGFLQGIPSG
jgi:3-methylcrotonyl-CoA carboxylase beta subunit